MMSKFSAEIYDFIQTGNRVYCHRTINAQCANPSDVNRLLTEKISTQVNPFGFPFIYLFSCIWYISDDETFEMEIEKGVFRTNGK